MCSVNNPLKSQLFHSNAKPRKVHNKIQCYLFLNRYNFWWCWHFLLEKNKFLFHSKNPKNVLSVNFKLIFLSSVEKNKSVNWTCILWILTLCFRNWPVPRRTSEALKILLENANNILNSIKIYYLYNFVVGKKSGKIITS